MYTLYWAPVTGSLAVQAVLEEIGAPYRLQLVDTAAGAHRSADYLRIAPNGKVPALVDGDGRAYFESAALVMLLCDRHLEAGLAPSSDDPARGHYYQWLLYLADTVYPAYQRVCHRERFSTDPGDSDRVAERARADLLDHWRVIDDALAGHTWLLGERYSACDPYLLMLASWFEPVSELLESCPNVGRCARAAAGRLAVARALETHGQLDALRA